MITRWLTRSFFIALLTLCVVAWVGSYWRTAEISYDGGHGTRGASLRLSSGRISAYTYWYVGGYVSETRPEWGYNSEPFSLAEERASGKNFYEQAKYRCLGFSLVPWWSATIPLWFTTLLAGLLLWFAWRKTKPKPIGRAFPIEPAAKPGESKP